MKIVAITNLDEGYRKLAIKRLKQNDNVILFDINMLINLSKAGILKNYMNSINNDIENIVFVTNDNHEQDLLINIFDNNIHILDGKKIANNSVNFLLNIDNYFNKKSKFSGTLKLPYEYNNVPKDYQDVVYNIYNDFNNLDNRVNLLLVTGSVNRGCVFDKWSDIDLIVVVNDKNDQKTRDKISDIVNKQKIKVGTTVYSKTEFESLAVDFKTMAAISDINKGVYRPLIISDELNIPIISREDLIIRSYELIPNMLHSMRRYTYKGCKIDYIKLFKDLSHFMRTLAWMGDMFPKSYEDVATAFYNTYGTVYYSPNCFLRSITTNKDIDREKNLLVEKTKEFLDFCDNTLLRISGDNIDRKVRKLQN